MLYITKNLKNKILLKDDLSLKKLKAKFGTQK